MASGTLCANMKKAAAKAYLCCERRVQAFFIADCWLAGSEKSRAIKPASLSFLTARNMAAKVVCLSRARYSKAHCVGSRADANWGDFKAPSQKMQPSAHTHTRRDDRMTVPPSRRAPRGRIFLCQVAGTAGRGLCRKSGTGQMLQAGMHILSWHPALGCHECSRC